jgi:hypothetical protein
MLYNASELLKLKEDELDQLFRESPAGEIPNGSAKGTAIVDPGSAVTGVVAEVIKLFLWQGKVFDASRKVLENKISPFGVEAITATIYEGPSWFDGNNCIVLDYSETSIVAHRVRDEIRCIAPNVYLGIAYWEKTRVIYFALEF